MLDIGTNLVGFAFYSELCTTFGLCLHVWVDFDIVITNETVIDIGVFEKYVTVVFVDDLGIEF